MSRNLARRKHVAWSIFKRLRRLHGRHSLLSVQSWFFFKGLNSQYQYNVLHNVSNYESSLVSSGDPKRLHGDLRNKKIERPSISPLLVDGSWVEECGGMSDCLAFSSVFASGVPANPPPHQLSLVHLTFHEFSINDVHKALI